MLNKKDDPIVQAVEKVMEQNRHIRQVTQQFNETLGIEDRKELPHELQSEYDQTLGEMIEGKQLNEENLQELVGKNTGLNKLKDWLRDQKHKKKVNEQVTFESVLQEIRNNLIEQAQVVLETNDQTRINEFLNNLSDEQKKILNEIGPWSGPNSNQRSTNPLGGIASFLSKARNKPVPEASTRIRRGIEAVRDSSDAEKALASGVPPHNNQPPDQSTPNPSHQVVSDANPSGARPLSGGRNAQSMARLPGPPSLGGTAHAASSPPSNTNATETPSKFGGFNTVRSRGPNSDPNTTIPRGAQGQSKLPRPASASAQPPTAPVSSGNPPAVPPAAQVAPIQKTVRTAATATRPVSARMVNPFTDPSTTHLSFAAQDALHQQNLAKMSAAQRAQDNPYRYQRTAAQTIPAGKTTSTKSPQPISKPTTPAPAPAPTKGIQPDNTSKESLMRNQTVIPKTSSTSPINLTHWANDRFNIKPLGIQPDTTSKSTISPESSSTDKAMTAAKDYANIGGGGPEVKPDLAAIAREAGKEQERNRKPEQVTTAGPTNESFDNMLRKRYGQKTV